MEFVKDSQHFSKLTSLIVAPRNSDRLDFQSVGGHRFEVISVEPS